jgi:hypothetical protein
LVAWAPKQGGLAVKVEPHRAGFPDYLVLLPEGHHFFVELKWSNLAPRANQEAHLAALRSMGHVAGWATSMEEVLALAAQTGWQP